MPPAIAAIAGIPALLGTAGAGLGAALGTGAGELGLTLPAAVTGAVGSGLVDAGVGAGLGALTGAVTGGNVGKDALLGGLGGGVLGAASSGLGAIAPATSAGAGTAGAGASAAATAAPAGAVAAAPDVTATFGAPGASSIAAPASGVAGVGAVAPTTSVGGLTGALTPGVASTAPATSSGFLGGLEKQLMSNPSAILGGVGLLGSVLEGNQKPPGYGTLQAEAGNLAKQGGTMEGYLNSGTLPPGLQTSLNSASEAAKSAIRARYAQNGMSGSSAEQQDLQRVSETTVSQGADIAMKLYNTGLNEVQMSDEIYTQLMETAMKQDQALSSAVGNFAGSLALSGAKTPVTP